MHGPDVGWYLVLAALLFVDRRARRADPPQPADHPALGRDHAQRREPRPDRVRAPLRARGRPGLRDRGDGDRRLRGGRRARPDRRDGPAQRRARRRQAADARADERRRLDLPRCCRSRRRSRSRSPARASRAAAPATSRPRRRWARSPPRSSRFVDDARQDARATAPTSTTSWTWLSAGQYHFGLTLLTDQLLDADDADRRRRRLADRRLLGRLHGRRGRGAPLLRLHVAVRLLDAAARAGGATCCCCSPAGAWSASRATC